MGNRAKANEENKSFLTQGDLFDKKQSNTC